MKIPTPQELGLPEHLETWRPSQEDALSVTVTQKHKRVKALCMPTGSGKSAIAVASAILSKEPTAIVTHNKGLQNQYLAEFESTGMVDLRGRNNYPCLFKEGEYSCQEGYAAKCPHKGSMSCPASRAEMRAGASNLVLTNYAKWTSSSRMTMGLSHIKNVIFDEGHYGPDAVANAMQILLHHKEIEEVLEMDFPPKWDCHKMTVWKPWAHTAKVRCEREVREAKERITGPNTKSVWVKHYTHMQNLLRRLMIISAANPMNWEVEEVKQGYQFDPIRPGKYAESALLMYMDNITFLSASFRPKTLALLHIPKEDYFFKEYESEFNAADCPIYYVPTMRVDSKQPDLTMLWIRLDQILAARNDRRGLIHTISYARRDDLLRLSRFAKQMIINPQGEPPTEMVEAFYDSAPNTRLVSPSIGTGYDFPGTAAEFQIVLKIPFEPPSRITKAREQDDKEYRGYRAMQYMEQAFGRINRFKGDRGESFIPDCHLDWFIPRFGHLASKNFHRRFKKVEVLPQPLRKM